MFFYFENGFIIFLTNAQPSINGREKWKIRKKNKNRERDKRDILQIKEKRRDS